MMRSTSAHASSCRGLSCALLLLIGVAFGANVSAAGKPWDQPDNGRIVAIADVHGAYDEFRALLRRAGVIDEQDRWIGGTTQLVSTGDLVDRGAHSRQVLELLIRLQREAPKHSGRVYQLLGNHELMVMSGDLGYVSAAEFAAFASEEPIKQRQAMFDTYVSLRPDQDPEVLKAEFAKHFPPGYLALSDAFGRKGRYGKWLLAQAVALKIGDTVFLHGGISSDLGELTLKQINRQSAKSLDAYLTAVESLTELGILRRSIGFHSRTPYLQHITQAVKEKRGKRYQAEWMKVAENLMDREQDLLFDRRRSAVWYRGNAWCHPYVEAFKVEKALAKWRARRVVVGHTHTPDRRVHSRLDGRVILADTGMLASVYKGRASAVLIENGSLSVLYTDEAESTQPVQEVWHFAGRPQELSDVELERFLKTAAIVESVELPSDSGSSRRLTLESEGRTMNALFNAYDSHPGLQHLDSSGQGQQGLSSRPVFDIVAYKLDRMLDLQTVPVAVERDVEEVPGTVQAWPAGTISERDRAERSLTYDGSCSQRSQYALLNVFDALIHNEKRNASNVLWTEKRFNMVLLDHTQAFGSTNRLPEPLEKETLELSDPLYTRLVALQHSDLVRELGAYLHARQIEAILERRDRIVKASRRSGRKD